MAGDIEEFLRRAAQRRAGKSAPPRQQPSPQQQPPLQQPPRQQPPPQPQVLEAEVVQPDILRGDSVTDHVSEHIGSSGFGERLSHLGEVIDHADDRMEEHLQEHFEHKLGQLGAKTSAAEQSTLDDDDLPVLEEVSTKPATDFLQMLSNPASISNAIILNEILNRPEDRW